MFGIYSCTCTLILLKFENVVFEKYYTDKKIELSD
jgi:hypothetical protein